MLYNPKTQLLVPVHFLIYHHLTLPIRKSILIQYYYPIHRLHPNIISFFLSDPESNPKHDAYRCHLCRAPVFSLELLLIPSYILHLKYTHSPFILQDGSQPDLFPLFPHAQTHMMHSQQDYTIMMLCHPVLAKHDNLDHLGKFGIYMVSLPKANHIW